MSNSNKLALQYQTISVHSLLLERAKNIIEHLLFPNRLFKHSDFGVFAVCDSTGNRQMPDKF